MAGSGGKGREGDGIGETAGEEGKGEEGRWESCTPVSHILDPPLLLFNVHLHCVLIYCSVTVIIA